MSGWEFSLVYLAPSIAFALACELADWLTHHRSGEAVPLPPPPTPDQVFPCP